MERDAPRPCPSCKSNGMNIFHQVEAVPSNTRVFRANGFEVLGLSTEYEGQYLTIEARAAAVPVIQEPLPEERDIDILSGLVSSFPERLEVKRREWAHLLEGCARDGKKAVIWGAASKAVAFLSTVPSSEIIRFSKKQRCSEAVVPGRTPGSSRLWMAGAGTSRALK